MPKLGWWALSTFVLALVVPIFWLPFTALMFTIVNQAGNKNLNTRRGSNQLPAVQADDESLRNAELQRIENLLDVLVQDSSTPAKELIPVAGAGLKLLTSSRGSLIRKNLLMSIIKNERIDTKDMKQLIKLVRKTFNPLKMAAGLKKQNNTQVA